MHAHSARKGRRFLRYPQLVEPRTGSRSSASYNLQNSDSVIHGAVVR